MNRKELIAAAGKALDAAQSKTIVLVGDFCLDVYFHIDSADLEPSLETGLMVRRVNTLKDSLGGAGNVFANLRALGVGRVIPVGVIGPDLFGSEMQRLLVAAGSSTASCAISAEGAAAAGTLPERSEEEISACRCGSSSSEVAQEKLYVQQVGWTTPAYMKPILDGKEQERIDTGLGNRISEQTVDALLARLETAMQTADVVMINQQLEGSIYTDRFIAGLNALAAANPEVRFIVDARTMQNRFHGMWHKFNTHEVAAEAGIALDPMASDLPADEIKPLMLKYFELTGDPLIVSRGQYGALAFDGKEFYSADGISFLTELDTVGAGDSFFAGFALSLSAGLDVGTALAIGNGVAGVTVQKLHQTGTSSPAELLDLLSTCDYTYNADANPVLMDTPFKMEAVSDWARISSRPAVEYAVFDHDGTISVLREGWEEVMEECMVDAITGGREVSSDEVARIRRHCREFITRSTGIQTINQMVMLTGIVRDWGLVPESEIKTAKEYKAIYNEALMKHIAHRLEMVEKGILPPSGATMAGSVQLLRKLAEAGVKIYLASGTDVEDVRHEATLLGYADCFTGGIFGSVGDVKNDPKRQVLRDILTKEGVDMNKLVIFGDGPVEMREAHDNGALAFGVLSNETRRYGWNQAKRGRLLHAGADILVPDFLEYDKIADFLLKR